MWIVAGGSAHQLSILTSKICHIPLRPALKTSRKIKHSRNVRKIRRRVRIKNGNVLDYEVHAASTRVEADFRKRLPSPSRVAGEIKPNCRPLVPRDGSGHLSCLGIIPIFVCPVKLERCCARKPDSNSHPGRAFDREFHMWIKDVRISTVCQAPKATITSVQAADRVALRPAIIAFFKVPCEASTLLDSERVWQHSCG